LTFYKSKAYKLLEKEETKLWHLSSAQIFAEYMAKPKRLNKSYQNGPGRSKLSPYAEKILFWHAQGMTLRAIALELKNYGCITSAQNVTLFLKRR
jgi:hypothetical protein